MVQLNIQYARAAAAQPSKAAKVTGVPLPKKGLPLLENLDNFIWLPPREGTAMNAVVAAAPLGGNKVGQRPVDGRIARK